jgi:hypothetical protein
MVTRSSNTISPWAMPGAQRGAPRSFLQSPTLSRYLTGRFACFAQRIRLDSPASLPTPAETQPLYHRRS